MDKLEEVKKLKQLLDDGIINDEDFKIKKAQILGITSEVPEEQEESVDEVRTKSKSLDDYEKELIKQSKVIEEEKLDTKLEDEYYRREKLKEKAKLDAKEEMRSKIRNEQKEFINEKVNKTKRILKWILAVFLFVFGITSISISTKNGILYIPLGIIIIVLGCIACPKITDKTQKYQSYTMHKTAIVWIIVVIWLVLCIISGNNVSA